MVRVVVDAMGGDEPAEVVLEGIERALAADKDLEVVVAGPADVVNPFCAKHARAEALVCTEVIGMAEHPTQAVRKKKDSTIVAGCRAVRKGEADAFFSAGSTGAILAAGTLVVGRVKGVSRAAIATAMPGLDGHMTTFLDMGANADCTTEMIVQFARMGCAYSHIVLGVEKPSVGLLNNGTEETKGSQAALERHEALAAATDINFAGNCEGRDILTGPYDVIVTDGFTGNVAVKTVEGTAKFIVGALKAEAAKSKKVAVGALMVKPALKGVAKLLSGDQYGGAALLGLKAPVLVGHGATNPEAVMNGTLTAAACARQGLCEKLASAVAPRE